jgi:hypothetical protein
LRHCTGCSAACLAYAAGWNGFEPRAGKPARDAVTAHDLAGLPPTTPTVALRRFFLACSRDSECTYLRRPCICTRSVRRASACAQTAVGQSDRRQLRVVTAARSVLRAVLHMPCTPAARCLGGGVAASHALRSAVTMLRRNTPRCDIVRRVATWHKMLQHNTACCNTCSTVQHVCLWLLYCPGGAAQGVGAAAPLVLLSDTAPSSLILSAHSRRSLRPSATAAVANLPVQRPGMRRRRLLDCCPMGRRIQP